MIVVGGSSSRDLAKELASLLDCMYVQAATTRFPDGECYTRIDTPALEDDVVIVQNTYPDGNLIEMFLLQDAVKRMGAKTITLVIPYFGYARQDRVFKPGEPESAKVVSQRLDLLADKVITIDIHKPDVLRFFTCPTVDLRASAPIADYFIERGGIDIVLAPDMGAKSRAKEVGDRMGKPHDYLEKVRISGTEVKVKPAEIDVAGKNILIVDDIIATGGTIIAATSQLKEAGVSSVTVACTHGVFVSNALERLTGSLLDGVLCCNTLENEVSHISVAPIIAETLRNGA